MEIEGEVVAHALVVADIAAAVVVVMETGTDADVDDEDEEEVEAAAAVVAGTAADVATVTDEDVVAWVACAGSLTEAVICGETTGAMFTSSVRTGAEGRGERSGS